MSSEFWFRLGTIVMLAGGLAILLLGKRRTPAEELQTLLHGIVPLFTAGAYFAMAIGQGAIVLPTVLAPTGTPSIRLFYFARYLDWLITTPLLATSLVLTAMHTGQKRPGVIAGIVLSDLMMILTAMFFGASELVFT